MRAKRGLKVLVVDDSALMRRHLRQMLESDARISVETARNGQDALDRVEAVDPDVITLDINMPVMDGLTCLAHLMEGSARPVVMVSSLTEKGALATFEALELGAVDYVGKPDGTVSLSIKNVTQELLVKVWAAARSRRAPARQVERLRAPQRPGAKGTSRPPIRQSRASRATRTTRATPTTGDKLVLIGVSTGGPPALQRILSRLPAAFPWPILISQHMPARFTKVFAERMNGLCELEVSEVRGPIALTPGRVLVARGGADVIVSRRRNEIVAMSVPSGTDIWHPSVERMVRTAMDHYAPSNLIAVQLTGMGNDGAPAMAELHSLGGRTIAESEETAVVFGMPKDLIERGGASVVLPLDKIVGKLRMWTRDSAGVGGKAVLGG